LLVAACGGGGGGAGPAGNTPAGGGSAAAALRGSVHGGQFPVSGSSVTLYAAGSGNAAATVLGTATTDGDGNWNIDSFTCPAASTPAYVTASGGNPGLSGTVDNGALFLVAALGPCGNVATAGININELSTAAAAYALAAFADTANPASIHGYTTGLANAMGVAALLAGTAGNDGPDLSYSAATCGASGAPANCGAELSLNTLGNVLASCVNTSAASSSECAALFACAASGATYSGGSCSGGATGAADTWQAALAIARNPGTVPAAGVYSLGGENVVFSPTLSAAPNDWTLALTFSGVSLSEPTTVALDASGNAWIANYNDRVVELAPNGTALSPDGGYTGGGLEESFGLAIDASGNVWVANEQSASVNSGDGTITELSPSGSVLSGDGYGGGGLDFPQAIAIDGSGNVWAVNAANSSVTEISDTGTALSPDGGYTGGGLSYPVQLAFDPSGNLWVANQAQNAVSELGSAGGVLSPTAGYTGGGLDVPQGLAVDTLGNVWVSNYYGDSVTELDSSGAPVASAAYGGGGLSRPAGIAIDGAGRVWVANYDGNTLSELEGASDTSPGTALSPSTGFTSGILSKPYAPAIDASGNVWVANFGNNTVTMLVGAASPVQTPRIGVPEPPTTASE
jgi:streptogramin lyase